MPTGREQPPGYDDLMSSYSLQQDSFYSHASSSSHHEQSSHAGPLPPAAPSSAKVNGEQGREESAASILQSVKEQEEQFEALTRELEAERQSVANQLERCKLGSETASMSSISSTDESFHFRPPPHGYTQSVDLSSRPEEESDAESKMSGSQLVDSCLRVLQERGLMNVGEDPLDYFDQTGTPLQHPPQPNDTTYASHNSFTSPNASLTMNGPTGQYGRSTDSPNPSIQSGGSNRPMAPKSVLTTRHIQRVGGGSQSSLPQEGPYGFASSPYHGSQNQLISQSPAQRSRSPASSQGQGTPTRFNPYDYSPRDSEPDHRGHPHDHYGHPGGGGDGYYPEGAPQHYSDAPPRYTSQNLEPDSYDQHYIDRGLYEDPYGTAPPRDHNDSYHSDRPNGDPFRDIPHIDDGGYPNAPPPEAQHYRPYPGDQDTYPDDRYPLRGDDPYQDARPPEEDPYGRRIMEEPPRQTPSLSGPAYGDPYNPYGSRSQLHPEHERPVHSSHPRIDSPNLSNRAGPYDQEDPYGRVPPHRNPHHTHPEDNHSPYGLPPGSQSPPREPDNRYHEPSSPYDRQENPYDFADNLRPFENSFPPNENSPNRSPYDKESPYSFGNNYRAPPPEEDPYGDRRPPFDGEDRGRYSPPYNGRHPADDLDDRRGYDNRSPAFSPQYQDELTPLDMQVLGAPPGDYDNQGQQSPSLNSDNRDTFPMNFADPKWRNPDLPEVIEFLSHPNNAIKANAAAYLQHLCYMDDNTKAKARTLGGIPALVELVNNDIPEVHRGACGALRNLSYGKANDDNKRAIKNAGGIPALVRLLRKSPDNDVRELVTGILWNLSSCANLKKPIIDDGLAVMVNSVIIPHSGWDPSIGDDGKPRDVYWTTVFRNTSGVLRNVSSDGPYARKKLRECEGLVDSIFYIVNGAIGKNDIDNKSIENCVCILRNLSYACQEVEDPTYEARRKDPKAAGKAGESTGCFGGNKKKKDPKADGRQTLQRPRNSPVRGMELLWQPEVVRVYLSLLSDCSNPETLEAAAGAIQNLAACEWQASADIRAAVRKERGLPVIVELLTIEADLVVCAAATALRNLALDFRNRDLIGKYAMQQLVSKLPAEGRPPDFPVSDNTIAAILATLYEVIKKNPDFAQSLLKEEGVERLIYINSSRGRFSPKVVKFASSNLFTLWQFKELHPEYKAKGWKEHHFITKTMAARGGPSASANNTLNRPRMDLGGSGVMYTNTPPTVNSRHHPSSGNSMPQSNHGYHDDHGNTRIPNKDPYSDPRDYRTEDIPMNNMGAPYGNHGNSTGSPTGGYASIEGQPHPHLHQQQHQPSPRDRDDYRAPAGGVPLFANLPPSSQQPQPQVDPREPLYAQVNKGKRREDGSSVVLDGSGNPGGADSWV